MRLVAKEVINQCPPARARRKRRRLELAPKMPRESVVTRQQPRPAKKSRLQRPAAQLRKPRHAVAARERAPTRPRPDTSIGDQHSSRRLEGEREGGVQHILFPAVLSLFYLRLSSCLIAPSSHPTITKTQKQQPNNPTWS